MKKLMYCLGLWGLLTTMVLADFPYYVAPDILQEVQVNEALFEQHPTNNKIMFDLKSQIKDASF